MLDVYHVGHFSRDRANGVDRVIHNLGRLLEHDIGFHVVSFTETDEDAYGRDRDGAVTIHRFGRSRGRDFLLPARFRRWLAERPAEALVHLHSVFAPRNYAIARECWAQGRAYVFTPHDSYTPRSMETRRLPKLLYLHLFERRVLDRAAAIQAVSDEGLSCIAGWTRSARLVLVRNHVPDPDPGRLRPAAARSGFICVGRMDVFQKGLDRLIAAYGRLCHERAAPPLTLLGSCTDGERAAVSRLIADAGLVEGRDVLIRTGLSDEEKERRVAGSQVHVQLSRFEGFGLSVAEALALQVPVIVSPEIPLAAHVRDYDAGWVAGSIDEAVAAMHAALDLDPHAYAGKADGAARLHRGELSAASVRERMLDLYRSVQAGPAARTAAGPSPLGNTPVRGRPSVSGG